MLNATSQEDFAARIDAAKKNADARSAHIQSLERQIADVDKQLVHWRRQNEVLNMSLVATEAERRALECEVALHEETTEHMTTLCERLAAMSRMWEEAAAVANISLPPPQPAPKELSLVQLSATTTQPQPPSTVITTDTQIDIWKEATALDFLAPLEKLLLDACRASRRCDDSSTTAPTDDHQLNAQHIERCETVAHLLDLPQNTFITPRPPHHTATGSAECGTSTTAMLSSLTPPLPKETVALAALLFKHGDDSPIVERLRLYSATVRGL